MSVKSELRWVAPYRQLKLCVAIVATACASEGVQAGPFEFDNGVTGRWGLDMSLGSSWRTRDADTALIGRQNGGSMPSSSTDDGNLNYKNKGDNFSTIAKVIGELQVEKNGFGVFLRGKGWYDYTQKDRKVSHGSNANGYAADSRLEDSEYNDRLSKFSGIELLDWYGFGGFAPTDNSYLSFKLGSHAVNWGESLFISGGINQYNPVDVSAARRAGAQVKEIILPTQQISLNLGVGEWSFETFYKLKVQRTVLEGCGTYWSVSDSMNCQDSTYALVNLTGMPDGDALAANLGRITGVNQYPRDSGSYGFSVKRMIGDVDVGAYFVNYTTTSPRISLRNSPSTAGGPLSSGPTAIQGFWDWSANNIKVYGLSAATELGGWSVFGEISHTKDFPVQINGADLVGGYGIQKGGILGQTKGPFANIPVGGIFRGYDVKDKTQIQVSTIQSFAYLGRMVGADTLSLMGEVAYQHWSGIGDPLSSTRYGRGFEYGSARWAANGLAGNCVSNGSSSQNAGCDTDGFATSNAWGYRAQATLQYNNVLGVNLTPRAFFSHDVKGYSADNIFLEGRKSLGLGVRADYRQRYYADLSYTTYDHDTKYDSFRDRDFISLVIGMNL
ncbi:DUF1302 domain-containing protein [Pseudomonas sp. NPDC077186]|uniref:DUF1302 domain-containing protein n=1 Tax=Pseudomonas sp. NPDC077186 TaxID=3364421 RepID=UPI0037CA4AC5